ncbi:hypothetical protein RUND412_004862 [Rhizina undulata]
MSYMNYRFHVLERVGNGDEKVVRVLDSFYYAAYADVFAKYRIRQGEEYEDIDFLYKAKDCRSGGRRLISFVYGEEYRHVWVEKQECPPRNSGGEHRSLPPRGPLYAILTTTVFTVHNPKLPQRTHLELHPNIYSDTDQINDIAEKTLRVKCGLDQDMTLEWLGKPFEDKTDENGFYWGRVELSGELIESIMVQVIKWEIELE